MELEREKWNENLKLIRPKVKSLFYKGNVDLLLGEAPKLAIVGSRRMTDYGARIIEKWMPELVRRGVVIVSGFMYGVDQAAHKACVENGGKTIAVLGYGIDRKVSGFDEKLYQNILQVDSLILSEYPENTEASIRTFPERNRIVAGISDAVLVIEAAKGSGSLITARLAGKFGKPLLALPGRTDVSVAWGTNDLIKTGKALMVTEVEDVVQALGMVQHNIVLGNQTVDPVLRILENGGRTIDEMTRELRLGAPELAQKLMIFTLQGEVEERNGKFFLK